MLDETTVDQIKALLKQGKISQRAIAEMLGVSRGSVHAIAAEKRRLKPRRKSEIEYPTENGRPERCPTCGHYVRIPCLACQLRQLKKKETSPQGVAFLVELDLREPERKRYLRVKKWRESLQNPHTQVLPAHHPLKRERVS